MGGNPFLGVFFHWLGGLASGSFYVPYKGVKKWSWETYWLVGGFFSWIIMPWLLASVMTSDVIGVLKATPQATLVKAYLFGAMWGFGGLTFGLTMRYLGMSLGMGVALGYCAAFGTLLPPVFKLFIPAIPVPETIVQIAATTSGKVILLGVAICLAGIAIAAIAGLTKEREMPEAEKKKTIAEFSFSKGILVATFSGIMSAGFSFGMTAGEPITVLTLRSDYIHAAKADKVEVKDVASLDGNAADELAKILKATPFFQAASKNVQADPSFGNVVEQVELPLVLQAELADLKSSAGKLQGKKLTQTQKQIEEKEQQLAAGTVAAPEQTRLLAQSPDPVAARVAAYAQQFGNLSSKPDELKLIHGLKNFTVKEVALATSLAGGNLLAYHKKHQLWQGLPRLIVILLGGFTVNFIWCVLLNIKNRTGYEYFASHVRPEHAGLAASGGEHSTATSTRQAAAINQQTNLKIPRLGNLFFAALAGTCWYFQFFFYSMGETQMGKFGFASWTLHMASIIIFSTMWGWIFHEWKGSSKKAHLLIAGGIGTLILSTVVIGAGVGWTDVMNFVHSL
jgi:L-rhamnose-proton symport protein (RhaT)